MADQQQLDLLLQGVPAWNAWRKKQSPGFQLDLSDARLSEVDLSGADFDKVNFSRTDFRKANLSRTWLRETKLFNANLSEANLSSANLSSADLNRANFYRATMRGASLGGTNLSYTNLSEADLREASFMRSWLWNTDLGGADLSEANLLQAILSSAILSQVNLRRAKTGWTIFGDVDLRTVKGLETVEHEGPSTMGTNTILRSQGDIPEIFLRGAGLSEIFITYARSLAGQPIDYYTCFISYSSNDQAFADRLYTDLQSSGVRCWFDRKDMKIGDKLRVRIDESIRMYDKLLLVLSEHSVNSPWVEQEVETALAKERDGKTTVLFPIRLDEAIMQLTGGWPALIRNTRHIGDFTNWKHHDDYQQALERLLRDLKAEA
jgi:hypothetical protein